MGRSKQPALPLARHPMIKKLSRTQTFKQPPRAETFIDLARKATCFILGGKKRERTPCPRKTALAILNDVSDGMLRKINSTPYTLTNGCMVLWAQSLSGIAGRFRINEKDDEHGCDLREELERLIDRGFTNEKTTRRKFWRAHLKVVPPSDEVEEQCEEMVEVVGVKFMFEVMSEIQDPPEIKVISGQTW